MVQLGNEQNPTGYLPTDAFALSKIHDGQSN